MSAHVRGGSLLSPEGSRPAARRVLALCAAGFGLGVVIGWVLGR